MNNIAAGAAIVNDGTMLCANDMLGVNFFFMPLSSTTVPDRMLTEGAALKPAHAGPPDPVRVAQRVDLWTALCSSPPNSPRVRLHLLPCRLLIRLLALPSYLTARKTPPR